MDDENSFQLESMLLVGNGGVAFCLLLFRVSRNCVMALTHMIDAKPGACTHDGVVTQLEPAVVLPLAIFKFEILDDTNKATAHSVVTVV